MRSGISLLLILILGIPVLYFVYFCSQTSDRALGPAATIVEISQYPNVLSDWSGTHLTAHFPPTIPASSSAHCFSASKGFMQGGAHIRLQLTLPADQIRQQDEHWRQKTIKPNEQIGKPPMQNLPSYFTIYLLKAEPGGNEHHPWNHADLAYVGVDLVSNQILYGAERW